MSFLVGIERGQSACSRKLIYTNRDREKKREREYCNYIHIYSYTHMSISRATGRSRGDTINVQSWVDMVKKFRTTGKVASPSGLTPSIEFSQPRGFHDLACYSSLWRRSLETVDFRGQMVHGKGWLDRKALEIDFVWHLYRRAGFSLDCENRPYADGVMCFGSAI